ncbi:hypothetical protein BDV93DRAFT_524878 [Ceratobasidium sp. AG-I]|nr:hypothetical protein BDV93DRAFT_524878 [Ceratobasidium sp. AG-I]
MEPDLQLGPIQNLPQYKKILSYFEHAHANNYKFALSRDVNPNPTNGLYIRSAHKYYRAVTGCDSSHIAVHSPHSHSSFL